jgi:hypothetical protein
MGYVKGLEDASGGRQETAAIVAHILRQMAENAERGVTGSQVITAYEDGQPERTADGG